MKTIFLDTNKIFGAYRYFVYHDFSLWDSKLVELAKKNRLVISYFVLQEIIEICKRQAIPISTQMVENFCNYIWISLTTSTKLSTMVLPYVNDSNDAQILHDATSVQANILLTNNLKDFNIDAIQKDFNIEVKNTL